MSVNHLHPKPALNAETSKKNKRCLSQPIGLSREASRTFSSSRALRTSTARSPAKIQPIEDWAEPRSVKNVLQFLSFASFYRRFTDGFSKVARPLMEQTKEDAKTALNWAEAARSALVTSKHPITVTPILVHFTQKGRR
jgi:hypothetical protein